MDLRIIDQKTYSLTQTLDVYKRQDLGLQETFCINRADNNSVCRLDQEYTRGLAFASNGTFKFNENLSMVPYNFTRNDSDYTIKEIYHEDGSVLKKLRIEDDLTLEQRQDFQNYEQQKEEYYLKKQQDTLEIMEEEQYDTSVSYTHLYHNHIIFI